MTKKFTIKYNDKETIGKVYVLDEDKTITNNARTWTIKSMYSALNSKDRCYSCDWSSYKHIEMRMYVYKDVTSYKTMSVFEDDKITEELVKEFGMETLSNCVVFKVCVQDTIRYLNNNPHPYSDLDYYKLSVGSKYKAQCESAKRVGRRYSEYIIVPYAYVKVCPRIEKSYWHEDTTANVIDLEFYSRNGKLVARLNSGSYYDYTCLKGGYSSERVPSKPKTIKTKQYLLETEIPVMEDCGCIDCKDSEYHITADGVFLRCTQCGEEVKEVEYDGAEYPVYCNRAIAKKIRKYQAMMP